MAVPVEAKVKAATGGSVVGTALAGLIIWLLDTYAWGEVPIPDPVVVAVWAVVPAAATFLGGWLARHTPRTVIAPVAPVGGYAGGQITPPTTRGNAPPQ